MTTEKALEILDEIAAAYEPMRRRDVLIVLRRARELLHKNGMANTEAPSKVPKPRRPQ